MVGGRVGLTEKVMHKQRCKGSKGVTHEEGYDLEEECSRQQE